VKVLKPRFRSSVLNLLYFSSEDHLTCEKDSRHPHFRSWSDPHTQMPADTAADSHTQTCQWCVHGHGWWQHILLFIQPH